MTQRAITGLRCDAVLAQLSDYLDGELQAEDVARIEEHLLSCPNCERFGHNFGSMVVSLRRTPRAPRIVDSEMVGRLLAELDALGEVS